jgi:serine/threonine-protein kinase
MGFVYRAWDARLHREVAIKLLNHEYSMPGMRERFLREARAASALNHPNICTIFDIGEQDGDPYLVMELLQGETLKDRIAERTLSVEEIVSIARETAEALGAAHSKGVIHRDIKPANIFLVEKPNGAQQAKVLDFGLAKMEGGVQGARQNRASDLTTLGATVGTLAYMSPEQARGEVLDSRSDLFSLGVVLYEMATRQVPFQGATSALVFVQLLNHPPEPVREWNEAIPRDLEKIIFKLLAKERTARFQTANELDQALAAVNNKPSGGWLRKAVSSVPMVKSADPVARSKPRLQRSHPRFPVPQDATRTPVPRNDSPRPGDDQFLRPVARVPRGDATQRPLGNTPAPEQGIASTFLSSSLPSSPSIDGAVPPSRSSQDSNTLVTPDSLEARSSSARVESSPIDPESEANPVQLLATVVDTSESADERPMPEAEPPISHDSRSYFPELLRRDPRQTRFDRFATLGRPLWIVIACALAGAALLYWQSRRALGSGLFTPHDEVVVTEIENRTGIRSLDGSVAEGLRIALAQSPFLAERGGASYRAARRLVLAGAQASGDRSQLIAARQIAAQLRTRAYLYGAVTGTSAPYLLHVDLRDSTSNAVLISVEARADSLAQITGAIDQVAADLRAAAGESRTSINQTKNPLAREGSGNIAALALFADGESLVAAREPVDAAAELQQAVTLDPQFVQAHLELAWLYRRLRAETAAAAAARTALAVSSAVSQRTRTLAQASYELNTSGNYPKATALLRQLTAVDQHDPAAQAMLAETLNLQGRLGEALQSAQQAYQEDPFASDAYHQAETALLGLDRYGAAFQLDQQVQQLGLARPGESLIAAYLDGRQDMVDEISANIPVGRMEYRPDWNYGMYLDSTGHLAAGAAHWRSRAEAALLNDHLKSAASFLLAQGALNRALVGECGNALAMARSVGPDLPAGRKALFNLGIASALCGDVERANDIAATLAEQYPESFEVQAFFLADLRAAVALQEHHPDAALAVLEPARPYDLLSLTPYFRGLAHIGMGDVEVGIVDLQVILAHQGNTLTNGSDVFPAAQIAVARAFAASGDLQNSAVAYRQFLDLWRTADPLNPLIGEAHAGAGN